MKFVVEKEIFNKMPNACFAIVVAKGIDNNRTCPKINQFLNLCIENVTQRCENLKAKDDPNIIPYREAFRTLGINPNKYMCSIEALFTRIAKGKGMPHINSVVDLGNAISLKYTLPVGAHDLGSMDENICIRLAQQGDTFLPFGSVIEETPDCGEIIYAVGHQVRTRRWTWRQSEYGKITQESNNIFFPIDGFKDFNKEQVLAARDELESLIKEIFECETIVGFVDVITPEIEL